MRRSKEDADATRAALLDAAEALFSAQGIARTRLEDIAQRADVTRGAVYWHFKNKEEIIDAMIERVVTPSEAALEHLADAETGPQARSAENLKNVILSSFDRLSAGGSAEHVTRFMLRYSLCAETPSVNAKMEEERRRSLQRLERFIAQAQTEGSFRTDIPAAALAVHIRAQIIGIFHQYLSDQNNYPNREATALSLDLLLESIAATQR